jgi:hypothetical protein
MSPQDKQPTLDPHSPILGLVQSWTGPQGQVGSRRGQAHPEGIKGSDTDEI